MQALDAGKHVLVEKPLSNDLEEARQMVELAAGRGLYLGCNLNHHFSDPADRAMELVRDGKIGEQLYCLMRMGVPGRGVHLLRPRRRRQQPRLSLLPRQGRSCPTRSPSCATSAATSPTCRRSWAAPGSGRSAGDPLVSLNSIHVRFASDAVGYLFSQRGRYAHGLRRLVELRAGRHPRHLRDRELRREADPLPARPAPRGAADPGRHRPGSSAPEPTVLNTGITDFGTTFPRRIHAFLEDVTNGVPTSELRASGRDALATLE